MMWVLSLCPSWFAIKIFIVFNAFFGGAIFLSAWKRTEKMRIVDKERDELFHSCTRLDA
jgi:hypothetical protein